MRVIFGNGTRKNIRVPDENAKPRFSDYQKRLECLNRTSNIIGSGENAGTNLD